MGSLTIGWMSPLGLEKKKTAARLGAEDSGFEMLDGGLGANARLPIRCLDTKCLSSVQRQDPCMAFLLSLFVASSPVLEFRIMS